MACFEASVPTWCKRGAFFACCLLFFSFLFFPFLFFSVPFFVLVFVVPALLVDSWSFHGLLGVWGCGGGTRPFVPTRLMHRAGWGQNPVCLSSVRHGGAMQAFSDDGCGRQREDVTSATAF